MLTGPFSINSVDLYVTRVSPGVYILSRDGKTAAYVGRSDTDVGSRIKQSSKENREEMLLLKVLMGSGRKECLEDIIALRLLFLKEPVNDFCGITIMRNHTGVLPKKNMAQDFPVYSETASGNPLDISQRVLPSKDISIPMDISISLLQREGSPLSERLTLMVKLMLMVLLISSGENLRGNMLLLLSLLIERDWLLNRKIRLSNLSLFQSKAISLLLCVHIQRGRSKFTMLLHF